MQTLLRTTVTLAALVIAWTVSTPKSRETPPPKQAAEGPVLPVTGGAAEQFRGLAIQLHGGTDVFDKYSALIPQIADLGANAVEFIVHGWQENASTLDLHLDPKKTAGEKELGKLCELATQQGLRVILMPVVLLDHPLNTEWRGRIIPKNHDWDAWFKRYTSFILHFTRIAERHKVAVLMVGSELIKTETYTDRWKRVIEEVRQNYRGKIGYSANWDHYQTHKIGFWPQLDYVGMTSYYELADGPNPTAEEIDRNWDRFKKEIVTFQREVQKPIIFTEVGWCSQEGAAKEGWNYYANQKATEAGLTEQARLYESFLRHWAQEPGIGGIIWWEWDTTPGGRDDYNYTPRGKPAEGILRRWFSGEQVGNSAEGAPRILVTPNNRP